MKKLKLLSLGAITLAGIAAVTLTSCSSNNVYDIYGIGTTGKVQKYGTGSLEFKKNSTIPYINIEEGVNLLSVVRSSNLDDNNCVFSIKKDGKDYVLSNETGAKCVISSANQTLTYDDYDKFTNVIKDPQKPLSILTLKKDSKAIKLIDNQYTPGKQVVVDLKPYTRLDIYENNGKCYLPLSVFNSVLFNTFENMSLAYNGKNLFFIPGDSLTVKSSLGPVLTDLGEKFREGATTTYTQEYAEYYYQSVCLDFDYVYGLKEKFTSFDKFLTDGGWKNYLISTDPRQVDNYTHIALSYLNDGHTALSDVSNMYEYGTDQIDSTEKVYKPKFEWLDNSEKFAKTKSDAGITDGIEYKNDTAFVTFKKFSDIDENKLYSLNNKKDDDDFTGSDGKPGLDFDSLFGIETNTAELFSKLYRELTTTSHKDTTKNIVVDLSANDGGSADSLIYSLSVLIGDVYFDMTNPLSGGHNHQTYKADMNLDGKVDSQDKCLADWNYNIYFVNSKYSFSSANAMPVVAKINRPNVVMLGEKTAGGPCSVRHNVTPLGNVIVSSSLNTISKLENGRYVNIDGGVPADFPLTEEQMNDRNYIVQKINSWKLN